MRKSHKKKEQNEAFTLVELIIAMIVITILFTLGFMSYTGYMVSARDATRVSQIQVIQTALESYKVKESLPLPENYVEVKNNGVLIAYQGYAGANVLKAISYTHDGLDPKDGTPYSYYVTKDRMSYQLMAMLEEGGAHVALSPLSQVSAQGVDYAVRFPFVIGHKLGITTDANNTPIHEIQDIQDNGFNIESETETFVSYLTNDDKLEGDSTVLVNLQTLADEGGKHCTIANDIVSCVDDNAEEQTQEVVYNNCDAGSYFSVSNQTTYNYAAVLHGYSTVTPKTDAIANGTKDFNAMFSCYNGNIAVVMEIEPRINCDENYNWNGTICESEVPPELYSFTTHTFTNCGHTGKIGPASVSCTNEYTTSWDNNSDFYDHASGEQGYQVWTVPDDATYTIQAIGAGRSSSYKGADIQGDFVLTKGDKLVILVGQKGLTDGHGYGGDGGSFVVKANTDPVNLSDVTPLVVAGGAGGTGDGSSCTGTKASYSSTSGNNGCNGQSGGTSGSDGSSSFGGGKGYNSFTNLSGKNGQDGAHGGFGGGGGGDQNDNDSGGGGGGYSGGGRGASEKGGGGGGSYNNGASKVEAQASSTGHGSVIITKQ